MTSATGADIGTPPDRRDSLLYRAAKRVYNRAIRPLLPTTIRLQSGVAVWRGAPLDATKRSPAFKEPEMDALRELIQPDDRVVVVGGGWGVGAVIAARQAVTGRVDVYEASEQWVERCRETAAINHVSDRVTVHHARVGVGGDAWGTDVGAVIAPAELPACDVLYVDCEGCERALLADYGGRAEAIVVEVHPEQGVTLDDIAAVLGAREYEHTVCGPISEGTETTVVAGVTPDSGRGVTAAGTETVCGVCRQPAAARAETDGGVSIWVHDQRDLPDWHTEEVDDDTA